MKKVSKVLVMILTAVLAVSVFTACSKGEGNTDGFAPSEAESILKDAGFTVVTSTKNTDDSDKILHSITAYKGAMTNMTTITIFVSEADNEDPGTDTLGTILYYKNIKITGASASTNQQVLEAFENA